LGHPILPSLMSAGSFFSLFILGLLVIIPIAIYNLGSKLDRINRQLEDIGNLLRAQQG